MRPFEWFLTFLFRNSSAKKKWTRRGTKTLAPALDKHEHSVNNSANVVLFAMAGSESIGFFTQTTNWSVILFYLFRQNINWNFVNIFIFHIAFSFRFCFSIFRAGRSTDTQWKLFSTFRPNFDREKKKRNANNDKNQHGVCVWVRCLLFLPFLRWRCDVARWHRRRYGSSWLLYVCKQLIRCQFSFFPIYFTHETK